LDEGNASGKFAFFGKLTEKDSVVLTDFTSNASNESLGTRLHLSYDTGARRSEQLKLAWDRVDLERGSLTFLDTKNGEDFRRAWLKALKAAGLGKHSFTATAGLKR
jgi:integrase